MPFTAANQKATYILQLPSATNFTTGTITAKIYVQTAGAATNLQFFAQTGASCYTPQFDGYQPVTTFASGFATTVTFDVGAATAQSNQCGSPAVTTPFDKTNVLFLGVQVIGATSGTSFNTATVWLDSITVNGTTPAVSGLTFDTSTSVGGTGLANTTGFGGIASTAAWQATCP